MYNCAIEGRPKDTITFQAEINSEQIIRPPADVVLPEGTLQVTVKPVLPLGTSAALSRDAANARLRKSRVCVGEATGIDNEQIDADLARAYRDEPAKRK